ncbi:unnamed protein product [Rhodiola kirilowii]
MGCAISNIDRVHWFLRALGTSFTDFSSVIMAQDPFPSYNDVVARAISHEIYHRSLSIGTGIGGATPSVAFLADSTGSRGRGSSSRRGRGRNSVGQRASAGSGGQRSHLQRGGRVAGHRPLLRCQYCGAHGHTAAFCYKIPGNSRHEQETANLAESFHSATSLDSATSHCDWYLDTGATNHMAPSASSLDSSAPYNEISNQGDRGSRKM